MSSRLAAHPFYAERIGRSRRPSPWSLEDLEDFAAASGDPYGGRLVPGSQPAVSVQLEACDDPPVWIALTPRELRAWSRVLERIWRRIGLRRGECLALFDYGASPLVLLASGSYAPHLGRGVAERLGITVLCNDGVASLADRMVEVVERVRPAALVLRRDVLSPFAELLERSGTALRDHCRLVLVTEPQGLPERRALESPARAWDVPLRRIVRADAAYFLAAECHACEAFHVDPRAYRLEASSGRTAAGAASREVCVTTRFARLCPAARHRLEGAEWLPGACALEPGAPRLRWA